VTADSAAGGDGDDLFRLAMDNSAVGMCLVSPEGAFTRVNRALCELLGRDEATITSSTWQQLTHPDDLDIDLSLVADVLAGRIDTYRLLKRFLRPDRTVVWGDLSVACVRDDAGDVRTFVSQIIDVTDREAALAALVESQELFHLVMDSSAVGMSLTSPEGRLLRVNDSLCVLFGRPREELVACSWAELTFPEDVDDEQGLLDEMLRGERDTYRLLKRFRRPDGTIVWGDLTISCVRGGDGSLRYFIGQVIDVSVQVRGNETLAATIASMLDPHVLFEAVRDEAGTVVDMEYASANEQAGRYLNREVGDLIGRRFRDLSRGSKVDTVIEWFTRVLDTGEPLALDDFRLQRSDGRSLQWLDIRAVRVVDRVSFTWRDVTDRHEAVAQIAEREAAYRLLAEHATDVIVRSAVGGAIEWVSPSVTEMLGWHPDQVVGRTVGDLMHPDDLARVRGDQKAIIDAGGTEGRVTVRFATVDGAWRWMSDHGRAIIDADGQIVGGIDSLRDVEAEHRAVQDLADREQSARAASDRAERAERELRGVVDSLFDPWVLLSAVRDEQGRIVDLRYVDANDAACRDNRLSRDELIGRTILDLLPEHGSSGLFELYAQVVETGEPLVLDDEAFTSPIDGIERRFDNRAVRVGDGISFTWRDVTERYALRQQLREQADSDLLTGVANRRRLSRRLTELLGHPPRMGARPALLYCDLDHFKEINDQYGHAAGDAVLGAVASAIRAAVREQDLVARLGGDEFAVLLDGVRDMDDAVAVAQKVLAAVRVPVAIGDSTVTPRASIGIALLEPGEDEDAVMARADAALYAAKAEGRDRAVTSPGPAAGSDRG
jgi:diguanylate cyclase (GGDEF)-like protein/PAS domain S-box-containing protein